MSETAITVQVEAVPAPGERAQELDGKIRATLSWMDATKEEAKHRIAALGTWLLEVSEKELYRELGHASFHRYVHEVVQPFTNLGVTQLYACRSVVEQLASHASPEQIERIGISKAYELAQAVRRTGRAPGEQLLLAAETLPVAEFKAAVAERFELREGEEKPAHQKWISVGGFYATAEEAQEFERALDCARRTDPVVPQAWPEWRQNKECLMRMAMEYLATYSANVETDNK